MLRRAALVASFSGAVLALSAQARAAGAWLSSGSLAPTEQRVAVAAAAGRTTLWTSLRFEAAGGSMGILVPAPAGASLDFSSDAWFEALEVATAPRIFPPAGVSPFCPGKSGSATVFEVAGQTSHTTSLTPQDVTVLPDAAAVSTWAAQAQLVVPPGLSASLDALQGMSFVAVRFAAPTGPGVTPTLRITFDGPNAVLPLALTAAGNAADLRVTSWVIGQGEADLIGATQVATTPSALVWRAGAQASNYDTLIGTTLGSGMDTFLVETTNHEALAQNVSIAQGTAFVDGVVTTYFERAAAYGDGAFGSAACIATASPLVEAIAVVAGACPRASLGVVDPAPACVEAPGAGQTDPASLRCGPGADDLALALSGLSPAATWVTRQSLIIAAGKTGADLPLGFSDGAAIDPVLTAASVDVSDCGDGGTSTSGSTGSSSSSSGSSMGSSSGMMSSGMGAGDQIGDVGDIAGDVADGTEDADSDDATSGCGSSDPTTGSCSGSSASSSSSSDGSDSCSSSDTSGDSCGSSDDSGSSCSGSSDGSSCSSGSDSSCSGSSDSSACSGSSDGGDACSGDSDAFKCTVAGPRHVRLPRMSILLMLGITIITPLRRRARPSRRPRRSAPAR